jgi:simple sugar transport system ATP-binding protein
MVGRPVSLRSEAAALGLVEAVAEDEASLAAAAAAATARPVLQIEGAVVTAADGHRLLDGLSISVAAGEIVGLAGVEGNGQRALGDVLASLLPLDAGTITVDGTQVQSGRPGTFSAAGVGIIPEDRHDSGCVLDLSVAENLALADPASFSRRGVLDRKAIDARARELIAAFDIQCRSPHAPMRSLSGGNQQRVVLARELSAKPIVLVAAQPTRGLDVGAIEYMGTRIKEAAASGVGVLLISTELEEILALSHRICVIHSGRIVGEMARHDADPERLGMLLGGVEG